MRVPFHSNRRSSLDGEAMTPMIDVVFLLLVFFVCASIGQRPDQLLPAALNSGTTESDTEIPDTVEPTPWDHQQVRIHLAIDPARATSAVVRLNEQPIEGMNELSERLRRLAQIDPKSPVILDVDEDVQIQNFISIYDLCQSLDFETINFATRIKVD